MNKCYTKDSCPEITIHNSNKEYDIINGKKDTEIIVRCNDGYSFNHDLLHQANKIKCAQAPGNTGALKWYIKDKALEAKCKKITTKNACNNDTYNPYKLLYNTKEGDSINPINIPANSDVSTGCLWDNGQCIFKKPVGTDNAEPLCKALQCPEKIVPNSNKIDNPPEHRPLPGPKYNKSKGSCIDEKGREIQYPDKTFIDNHPDCLCYQHQTCTTCANNSNCHWCGEGDKAACYSIRSKNKACATPIRQSGIGTCMYKDSHGNMVSKDGWSIEPKQSKDTCEDTNICSYVDDINRTEINGWKETFQTNLKNNKEFKGNKNLNDKKLCHSYQNKWIPNDERHILNKSVCLIQKDLPLIRGIKDDFAGIPNLDISLIKSGSNNYNISIKPYYCKAVKPANIAKCSAKPDEKTCKAEKIKGKNVCKWTKNKLDNNKVRWTNDPNGYIDKVKLIKPISSRQKCYLCDTKTGKLQLQGKACPTIPGKRGASKQGANKPIKNFLTSDRELKVHKIIKSNSNNPTNSGYIEFKDKITDRVIEIKDVDNMGCKIQYDDINSYNIEGDYCNNLNKQYLPKDKAISCIGGKLYCEVPNDGKHQCNSSKTIKDKKYCPTPCKVKDQKGKVLPNTQFTQVCIKSGKIDTFSSNCESRNPNFGECNKTGFEVTGNIFDSTKPYNYALGICNLTPNDPNSETNDDKTICEYLNKKEGNEDTVHWGKTCKYSNMKGIDNEISYKQICKAAGKNWKRDNKTDMWACFNDNGVAVTNLCETAKAQILKVTPKKLKSNLKGVSFTPSIPKCIVEVSNKSKESNTKNIKKICNSWRVKGYKSEVSFIERKQNIETSKKKKGVCSPGISRTKAGQNEAKKLSSQNLCNTNKKTIYHKKYVYNAKGHCKKQEHKPDKKVNWSGGEIRSDNNDNWSSECSSTINSTCPVVCNQKYGGGGDYVCHYNNHGRTVCDTINNNVYKNEQEKKDHCERFVTCTYKKGASGTKGKCIINEKKTDHHKGQLEWMGPECYLLNNEAFSHGIYNLPNLDEVYPPLIRLLTLSVIVIILLFISWKVGLLKIISNHVMGSIKDLFFKMIKGIEIMAVDLVISLTHVIKSIPDLPEIIKKDKTIVRNKLKSIGIFLITIAIPYVIYIIYNTYKDKDFISPIDILTMSDKLFIDADDMVVEKSITLETSKQDLTIFKNKNSKIYQEFKKINNPGAGSKLNNIKTKLDKVLVKAIKSGKLPNESEQNEIKNLLNKQYNNVDDKNIIRQYKKIYEKLK